MKRVIGVAVIFLAFGVTVYVTSYISRLPESNCSTGPISELWSEDHAYKASLLKKNCKMDETIFYSVRIDAHSPPLRHAWFTKREIADDEYPSGPPMVSWITPRKLEIEMRTRTLRGSLVEHVGDDLTVVRIFNASEPEAFPNY